MIRPQKAVGCAFVVLLFLIAQVPFTFGYWISEFDAPDRLGVYDVVIRANHMGLDGSYTMTLRLVDYAHNSPELEIIPVRSLVAVPPIPLEYKIRVSGEPVPDLARSDVTITFTYEGSELDFTVESLNGSGGVFSTLADVPFAGDYTARVYVETEVDELLYSGSFTHHFSSAYPSPELELDSMIFERIFTPGETFEVYAHLSFKGLELFGINILNVQLYEDRNSLDWYGGLEAYRTTISAPYSEGVYDLMVYAAGQSLSQSQYVFVVDTTLEKSQYCPAPNSECNSMLEARKCVYDYKAGQSPLTEDEVIQCILSADVPVVIPFMCQSAFLGDFDSDGRIDEADIFIMQNQILSRYDRAEYVSCADFDFDGNVDEDDLECMRKVIEGEWQGGVGGGFCMDYDISSILKGDLINDMLIQDDDEEKMMRVVDAAMRGAPVPESLLNFIDFNQDGELDNVDLECLRSFKGLSYSEGIEQPIRPETMAHCMAIYHMEQCQNIRGDLDGDGAISEIDEVLVTLIWKSFVPMSVVQMNCADVNKNTYVDEGDIWCIQNYITGDKEKYWENCLGCEESNMGFYYPEEICGDYFDNNCDGLVDKTSEDIGEDYCQCNKDTPCNQKWDTDGGTVPGIDDGNYLVCRKIAGFEYESDLEWNIIPDPECDSGFECLEMTCVGYTVKCSHNSTEWGWRDPNDLAHEDKHTLCEDGWDNNCIAGDATCYDPTPFIQMQDQILATLLSIIPMIGGMFFPDAGAFIGGVTSMVGTLTQIMGMSSTLDMMEYAEYDSPQAHRPQ